MSLATHDRPRAEREWQLWEWPIPMRGMSTSLLPYTLPPDAALILDNVYLDQGVVRRRFGFRKVGGNLDGPVIHFARAFTRSGSERMFAITTKSLYEFDYNTAGWINRASNVFNGQTDIPVSSAFHVDGNLYIANGVDNLFKFDVSSNTGSFVGTTFFQAPKAVASIASRLCVFNVEQSGVRYPNRVMYTPSGGVFDPSESVGTIDLADMNDIIVTVTPFRHVVLIRRAYSLWSMEATDETVVQASGGILTAVPLVFRFETINRGEFFEAFKSILATNEDVYFISGRELRRLRGGVTETVLPVGMTLRPLFEPLNDADMRQVSLGIDFKTNSVFIANPVLPNDSWLLRLNPRLADRPSLVKLSNNRVYSMGYGTVSFPPTTFNDLENNFGPFDNLFGVSFASLDGERRSALLLGKDGIVEFETETFSDTDGSITSKWTTSLSNFNDPWYKIVERVIVLVEKGSGVMTCSLGRSFDGVSIQWLGSQTKVVPEKGVLAYDWSPGEAPFWVVSIESSGVEDLKVGSVIAYWRRTSPGR